LSAYVITNQRGSYKGQPFFDFSSLVEDVKVAVRFLDNVIDASFYFSEENRIAQGGTRRIGLGTMGLADALIKLGIRYGSEESLAFIDSVYGLIAKSAYRASCDLAMERGPFPKWEPEYSEGYFINKLPLDLQERIYHHGTRNAVLLTQAPTGSTSLVAGVSSGIEPVFSFAMKRVDRTGESVIYHPLLEEWRRTQYALMDKEPPGGKGTTDLPAIPEYFVDAADLSPEEHIAVQSRIQRHTDSSISKTVNGPNSDTVEDVKRLYKMAYDSGCKGVTYYRDGSRDAVLTRIGAEKPQDAQNDPQWHSDTIRERPSLLHGYTRNIVAPEGTANITVNEDKDGPFEVFVNVGRAGSDVAALAEGVGRLISLVLRVPSSMSPSKRLALVASQLRGIGGSRFSGFGPNQVRSLVDAVAKVLEVHGQDSAEAKQQVIAEESPVSTMASVRTGNMCPECNQFTLIYEEGCKKCSHCGHSEC
jgi:ribonucleoside-diphosphate reductase alpha chain